MKKNLLAILVFITAFYFPAQCQNPALIWAGSSTSQVSPGNQILNSSKAVVTDAVGNVFVTGYFYGTTDFDFSAATANLTSAGGQDIYLAKYDASGNFAWAKRIGGVSDEAANAVAYDGTSIIITGTYLGTVNFDPNGGTKNLVGTGLHNTFIAVFDESGNLTMAKGIYGFDVISSAITTDGAGNIIIAGNFQGNVDFDPGSVSSQVMSSQGKTDIFMAKYDNTGFCVWAQDMGGSSFDGASAISIDPSGDIYLAGYFGSAQADMDPNFSTVNINKQGIYDFFIAKYNSSGQYIWAGGIGGSGSSVFARAIVADATGVYVTGSFSVTADFNPAATVSNLVSGGSTDAFIARYNTAGEYVWAENIPGSGPDESVTIATDSKNSIYIAGYIGGQTDFDPGAGTAVVNPSGFDIYMAKYDASGNYIWAKTFGSASNSDVGSAVTIDGDGNLYLSGTFTQSIDFDPGAGVKTLTTNPVGVVYNGDVFIAKYTNGGVLPVQLISFTAQPAGKMVELEWSTVNEVNNQKFIAERSLDGTNFSQIAEVAGQGTASVQNNYAAYDPTPAIAVNYYRLKQVDGDGRFAYSKTISIDFGNAIGINIYPNPSSSILTVRFNPGSYHTVQLISTDGKVVSLSKDGSGNVSFNMQQLPAGTYFVRLIGASGSVNKKIIKH